MRIGYFGDGRWAQRALPAIAATPQLDVAFVVPRYKDPDPVLLRQAADLGIPSLRLEDVNAPEAVARLREFSVDINVSMSFDQIFRAPFLATAAANINCHAGALPFYRGRNVLNWALINGETSFGVTVHHVDAGIDTGDIILQEHISIAIDDDYGKVLEKAETSCARLLHKALAQLAAGTASRTSQASIHPVGFYCPRRRQGDEWIDWQWPSERVFNFVRGIAPPGPGARARIDHQEIAILRAECIPDAPTYIATTGEVVGRGPNGCVVKTGNSTIRLTQVAAVAAGVAGVPAVPSFRLGSRLTGRPTAGGG